MKYDSILPQEGFVRLSTILKIIPIGKSTIWNRVKLGTFPKPVKISERVTAWPVEAIRDFIEQQNREGK
jgi:prophage regulatory protein